jgi:hypothetical protein
VLVLDVPRVEDVVLATAVVEVVALGSSDSGSTRIKGTVVVEVAAWSAAATAATTVAGISVVG